MVNLLSCPGLSQGGLAAHTDSSEGLLTGGGVAPGFSEDWIDLGSGWEMCSSPDSRLPMQAHQQGSQQVAG